MTKTSVIAPRCPLNGLTWREPLFGHIVVFHRRHRSFKLCLTLQSPGMEVHRLKGTSRQLVATANASGSLGCFESECKHLSFRLVPKVEGDALRRIRFTYTYNETKSKSCPVIIKSYMIIVLCCHCREPEMH